MEFSDIKGFGEKRIESLRAAGILSPADLISYFPERYIDTSRLSRLSDVNDGEHVVILACTREKPKLAYVRKGLNIVKARFVYDGDTVWCSWFRQPYMAKNIVPERYYYIEGRLKRFKSSYEIQAPRLITFTGNEPSVIPVYKPIGRISSALIGSAIRAVLDAVTIKSYVPRSIAERYGLSSVNDAFRVIHLPSSMSDVENARRALAIERMSYMLAAYSIINEKRGNDRKYIYKDKRAELAGAVAGLPYKLTNSQQQSIDSIIEQLLSGKKLNALLQGDVGSGKTIVAFAAMFFAVSSGYQSVMMAPTEILALQHYEKAIDFFAPLGIRCAYLSGSLNKKQRGEVIAAIANGECGCIFGTHALLQDDVEFLRLSLVIIDEQHRFGVAQRARLEQKTSGADCIVMSATPIPRTLALVVYGELMQITLDDLPPRRSSIATRYVPQNKEKDLWRYLLERARVGEQAFVVTPRVSDDDDEERHSAEGLYKEFKRLFGDDVALLHGRMKESVKAQTMRDFADGKIKLLVATTVVEVGIDVPNATCMVIYDAERFGLSQLHQLRGRVGRGDKNSFCFVLSDNTSPDAVGRIRKFVACSDGFELSEYDFSTRGAGDFLGYSQHGTGEIGAAEDVILLAKRISEDMLESDEATKTVTASITENKHEYFSGIVLN